MSQYTTGELAKACGVTVRTVQYYDQRGILNPSALTEGGRRLYSGEDLRMMRIICFLREIGLSIDTIGRLLREEDPGSVIDILLGQQEQVLSDEIAERRDKLDKLMELRQGLREMPVFSIGTIGDMADIMENRKRLSAVRRNILIPGIALCALQWTGILLWIFRGIWWPFAAWAVLAIPYGILVARYDYRNVAYICPRCHETFRPDRREFLFSKHTWRTRQLTCVKCGHHGFCVETWGGDLK